MRKLTLALAAIAALVSAGPAAAAILVVDNGILTGATGVDIGGSLYDVTFVDGTCAALFSGCDEPSDFNISGGFEANSAAVALLGQVFVDGIDGMFDSDPTLTAGCGVGPVVNHCAAIIPFENVGATIVQGVAANNFEVNDTIDVDFTVSPSTDTSPATTAVFALFTPHVTSSLPEPATWAMMLLGFGAMGMAIRRRTQRLAAGCY
jgi:hypothetical protein